MLSCAARNAIAGCFIRDLVQRPLRRYLRYQHSHSQAPMSKTDLGSPAFFHERSSENPTKSRPTSPPDFRPKPPCNGRLQCHHVPVCRQVGQGTFGRRPFNGCSLELPTSDRVLAVSCASRLPSPLTTPEAVSAHQQSHSQLMPLCRNERSSENPTIAYPGQHDPWPKPRLVYGRLQCLHIDCAERSESPTSDMVLAVSCAPRLPSPFYSEPEICSGSCDADFPTGDSCFFLALSTLMFNHSESRTTGRADFLVSGLVPVVPLSLPSQHVLDVFATVNVTFHAIIQTVRCGIR